MAEIINAFMSCAEAIAHTVTWLASNFGVWAGVAAFVLICRAAHKR